MGIAFPVPIRLAAISSRRWMHDVRKYVQMKDAAMASQLSPTIEARISKMVAKGDYADVDAMLDEALSQLSEHEKLIRLRAMIAIGVEQAERGDVVEYNQAFRDDAKRSALRRFASGEKSHPHF